MCVCMYVWAGWGGGGETQPRVSGRVGIVQRGKDATFHTKFTFCTI